MMHSYVKQSENLRRSASSSAPVRGFSSASFRGLLWHALIKRKVLVFSLLFLLVTLPIFYLVIKYRSPIQAAWYDDAWGYRKAIPITNSGSSTTNQYVKATLDTATLITAGKMQADCDDIRVTDIKGKILTHFVDGNPNYDCNEDDTSIYVLLDSLPASGAPIFVYYGKSSVGNTEPILGTDQNPGLSCRTIKEHQDNGPTDGLYFITPTGNLTDKIQVYCNMTANNGGGWTLMFQRRGGNVYHNAESCQSNLNAFLRNSCGSVSSLAFDSSYSIDLDNITNYGEFLITQYYSNLTIDTDDAYIIQSSTNIFPDSIGINNNIAVTSVCDVNNTNCDTTDVYFKYIGNGWYGSAMCNSGYSTGPYLGNYGYCQNGVATGYASNGLFGNRSDYSEAKLWAHDNAGDDYMERTYVRESSFSFSTYTAGSPASEEISPAPVAYWKFDEGYGIIANDSSSSDLDGTIGGAVPPTWISEDKCISSKCLQFANTFINTNYTSVSNATPLSQAGDLSVSSWFKANTQPTANSSYKVLVIQQGGSGTNLKDQYTAAGYNVVVDTAVTTVGQVAAYSPDIVLCDQYAWGCGGTLLNSLYDAGYNVVTKGNDTSTAIYPIATDHGGTHSNTTIAPDEKHPLGNGWASTGNSGTDTGRIIDTIHASAISIAKNGAGFTEIIYLEQPNKGRWFHYQAYGALNATLFSNLNSFILRYNIIGKGKNYNLFTYNGSLYGYVNNQKLSGTMSYNSWNHANLVYDKTGGNIYLYLNGKQLATAAYSTALDTDSLNISLGSLMKGFIDDVKIYPYARTAAQIKSDFASKGGGSVKGTAASLGSSSKNSDAFSNGLVGYWKMDEASWNGSANEVIDSSGNSNYMIAKGTTGTATTAAG
ncbi:MAG: fibrinogen-like YCDxxxxGGGW domain-containing protein, partial [Candidatus Berkelbacteria bacterium]|nr:fibrinogen-like YCDxxxxGGGW domain-containing protein [Candidatus Berkelbacteria bacterium]